MPSQKWLVSGKINFRKRLNLIDVGAESKSGMSKVVLSSLGSGTKLAARHSQGSKTTEALPEVLY